MRSGLRSRSLPGCFVLPHWIKSKRTYRIRTFVRPVALCILTIHTCLICGISIPLPKQNHTLERFPCENCPCGCASAAFCWDKCCCHSDEEKLAWAQKEGVTPPDFLVKRVHGRDTRIVAKHTRPDACCDQMYIAPAPSKSCCSSREQSNSKSTRTCCSGKRPEVPQTADCNLNESDQSDLIATAPKGCCSTRSSSNGNAKDTTAQHVPQLGYKVVLLDPAMRCLGIKLTLMLFSNNWIPDLGPNYAVLDPICLGWLCLQDDQFESVILSVDGPVPRVV